MIKDVYLDFIKLEYKPIIDVNEMLVIVNGILYAAHGDTMKRFKKRNIVSISKDILWFERIECPYTKAERIAIVKELDSMAMKLNGDFDAMNEHISKLESNKRLIVVAPEDYEDIDAEEFFNYIKIYELAKFFDDIYIGREYTMEVVE